MRWAILAVVCALALPPSTGALAASPPSSTPPAREATTAREAAAGTTSAQVTRLTGTNRYGTAVAVSQQFSAPVAEVYVATGADYPDALSAAAAAGAVASPVLLTTRAAVPAKVLAELRRLDPGRISVVGGSGVISDAVVRTLRTVAPVRRIAGADRYATSAAIVSAAFGRTERIVLATGRGYADALVAGAASGTTRRPVLLVDGDRATVTSDTRALLRTWGVREIVIAGGHGAVSIGIEQQLRTAGFHVTRRGGETRYATAVALLADADHSASRRVLLATGQDFPDALASAALAAAEGSPLYLVRSECAPVGVAAAVHAHGALPRTVAGGVAVLSDRAAQLALCAEPAAPALTWKTSGFTFRTDVAAPYADRPPVAVHDPSIALDSTGLRIYRRIDDRTRADHPVAYAQYGISALAEHQLTGETKWLQRAVRHAERLLQMRTERGDAWYYPYLFPWTYYSRTLSAPWWSAMGQGEALSLFVRLYEHTGEERWRTAAEHTWFSLDDVPSAAEPWSITVDGDMYWLEEYAGDQPPLRALNGHIFALFGLYDYWRLTGDTEVLRALDGASTAVLTVMPKIRKPGGISYYCWQPGYCQVPGWQNANYHPIHIWQLETLARLTDDARFQTWADRLRSDRSPVSGFRMPEHHLFEPQVDDGR